MLGTLCGADRAGPVLCYVAFQEFRSENRKREAADVKSAYKMFQGQAGGKPSLNAAVDQDRRLQSRSRPSLIIRADRQMLVDAKSLTYLRDSAELDVLAV
jgi:hypothetical protein